MLDTALESEWHVRAEAMRSTTADAEMLFYKMEMDRTRGAR